LRGSEYVVIVCGRQWHQHSDWPHRDLVFRSINVRSDTYAVSSMAFESIGIRDGPDFLVALGNKTFLVKANRARNGRWFGSRGGRWFRLRIRPQGVQRNNRRKAQHDDE